MRTKIVLMMITLVLAVGGCGGGSSYMPKSFPLTGSIFQVHEDALPIMAEMTSIQERVNGGRPVDEFHVLGLYVRAAGKKGNTKITEKRAKKALARYQKEIEMAAGAAPFRISSPNPSQR